MAGRAELQGTLSTNNWRHRVAGKQHGGNRGGLAVRHSRRLQGRAKSPNPRLLTKLGAAPGMAKLGLGCVLSAPKEAVVGFCCGAAGLWWGEAPAAGVTSGWLSSIALWASCMRWRLPGQRLHKRDELISRQRSVGAARQGGMHASIWRSHRGTTAHLPSIAQVSCCDLGDCFKPALCRAWPAPGNHCCWQVTS